MAKLTTIEWIKLLGFLSIVAATVLSIVWIPILDNQIEKQAAYVRKFTDRRILGLEIMLHNGQLDTQRMINFLEARLLSSAQKDKERFKVLNRRAFLKTEMMLKTWAGLFAESKDWASHADEQIHEIIQDDSLSEQEKFNHLDNLRDQQREAAFKRIEECEAERQEHRREKQKLESKRTAWYAGFYLLQIAGLILMSGGEIVQKLARGKAET